MLEASQESPVALNAHVGGVTVTGQNFFILQFFSTEIKETTETTCNHLLTVKESKNKERTRDIPDHAPEHVSQHPSNQYHR